MYIIYVCCQIMGSEWYIVCCLQLKELYMLLNENYVEDDDNMFRFDYSPEFIIRLPSKEHLR